MSDEIEGLEAAFLENPTVEALEALHAHLIEEGLEERLAPVLDKIRPIQHRVTLLQADATPATLEALARDPHKHVRSVVAAHPNISAEVCFRLSEDQQGEVRTALRKNPKCHPYIAGAIRLKDGPTRGDEHATAEHLLEIAWEARRAGLSVEALMELSDEWLGVEHDAVADLALEDANLLLQVLEAKLGIGRMPPKGKKKGKKKAKPAKKRRR
ncbi:MAG: hypothetical protein KDD82_25400 [Planctomycetes bacterium]|nr:hypothetical protein [Planctomycetota bacterium]